jgi:hypothetical protein
MNKRNNNHFEVGNIMFMKQHSENSTALNSDVCSNSSVFMLLQAITMSVIANTAE